MKKLGSNTTHWPCPPSQKWEISWPSWSRGCEVYDAYSGSLTSDVSAMCGRQRQFVLRGIKNDVLLNPKFCSHFLRSQQQRRPATACRDAVSFDIVRLLLTTPVSRKRNRKAQLSQYYTTEFDTHESPSITRHTHDWVLSWWVCYDVLTICMSVSNCSLV